MPVLTVSSFAAFTNLVVAACRLACGSSPVDRLKALADIATSGKSLDTAFGTTGLAAVAQEMTRVAENYAGHFSHPGPARDDAIALFWQVAPAAFADPATFAAAHLDPALTTDRMVAAIKVSFVGRDFSAAPLPEQFFRAVAQSTLQVMLDRADTVAALAPALWRQSLRTTAAIKGDTVEILSLVRELHASKQTTVPEATLIAMARKISPRVANRDEALRALDAAADVAAEAQARGETGSNVDAFIDRTLRRLATLTEEGRLDSAVAVADAAVEQAQAGLIQLLEAAVRQHLLAFDAEGAARQIVRRIAIEQEHLFDAVHLEQVRWHERGRDRGLRLDLEVAVALARLGKTFARNSDERGAAWNDLSIALKTLGTRSTGTIELEQALIACGEALQEWTRDRTPQQWALAQNNLGNALRILGERTNSMARFEEAIAAYRSALLERTQGRAPFEWAATQNVLGNALRALGRRAAGTALLEEAAGCYRAALEVRDRTSVPLDWATSQNNLGTVLAALGERSGDTRLLDLAISAYHLALEERLRHRVPLDWASTQTNLGFALAVLGLLRRDRELLEKAVAAHRAALEVWTREPAPLHWATAQSNLGDALRLLGQYGSGTARLEQAVAAYSSALGERTCERVPLDWAMTTGNQGIALRLMAERTSDPALARRARDQIAAAEEATRIGSHAPAAAQFVTEQRTAEALAVQLTKRSQRRAGSE